MPSDITDLVKQVELLEDYDQSSQALMEVVYREPAIGARLASNILFSKAGDVHLRAFAFSMLYRANRAEAFEYIRQNASTCEPKVFSAMLEEVAEDVGLLQESTALQQVVSYLRSAIALREKSDTHAIKESINMFLKAYGE